MEKNAAVDLYLQEGCGRCSLGGTPDCKVHIWPGELILLRQVVLAAGLTEELKWKVPCYTCQGKNIAIVSAFKGYAALSFFKGVLLEDPLGLLEKAGENSQSAMLMKFTSVAEIEHAIPEINRMILAAIEVEMTGKKPEMRQKNELEYPPELVDFLSLNPEVALAFEALTPGRKRGYCLQISSAKQPETRIKRIHKYVDTILQGKGWDDR